ILNSGKRISQFLKSKNTSNIRNYLLTPLDEIRDKMVEVKGSFTSLRCLEGKIESEQNRVLN
ncbi:MAG: hypothetical protein MHPSP_004214, partial [Paramarteilia canceri]